MLLCTAMNRLYLTALYCTFLAACDPPPPFSLQCVRFGHPKATAALKKQFAVSDKRFYWLKVSSCVLLKKQFSVSDKRFYWLKVTSVVLHALRRSWSLLPGQGLG